MRLRLGLLLVGALVWAAGCRTPSRPDRNRLPDTDRTFACALAHYGHGLLLEAQLGPTHTNTLSAFERAIAQDPKAHRLHSKVAMGHLMRQDYDAAIAVLERACRFNPDARQAWMDLALTCQLAGRIDQAIAAFEAALDRDRRNPFVYVSLTRLYLQRSNDAAALRMITQGLPHGSPRQLLLLATVRGRQLSEAKQMDAALPYLVILAEHPATRTPHMLNALGQAYVDLERYGEAEEAFREAIEQPDPIEPSFIKLASVLVQGHRLGEAVAVLRRAHARLPESPGLLFSLALTHNLRHDYVAAMDAFERSQAIVVAANSEVSEAFYIHYGATCERGGRLFRAERVFRECVERFPESHEALNYLAYMWAEQNRNLDEAEAFIERALALEPDNGAYIDTRGWIYYRQGRYLDALDEIVKANVIITDDPVINDHLGDIHDALRHRREAVHHWGLSLLLDPTHAEVAFKLDAYGISSERIRRHAQKR